MPRKIFIYDNDKKKVVEVKQAPAKRDDTRNHVNMRTTWSGQTKIEFSETTIDKSVENMNRNK